MKSKISAFMDGELLKQDASTVIKGLKEDGDLREEWKTYHLIGDALRHSSRLSTDVSPSVNQVLKTEPVILLPNTFNNPNHEKLKVLAFSVAASVIAMISAWALIYNSSYSPQPSLIADNQKQNNNLTAVPTLVTTPPMMNTYPPAEINDYLFVHREFSPGGHMRGQVTNVNSVTQHNERYGR